jgi:AraC family transcriptional regulator
LECSDLVLLE